MSQERVEKNIVKGLGVFAFTLLILKLSAARIPYGHGDALYYHLVAGKMAIHLGIQTMLQELNYVIMQGGPFEAIYFLVLKVFGTKLLGHQASQVTHFLLGQGLAAFLSAYFLRKHKALAFLSFIAILTIRPSANFFLYAKNDGAAAALAFWGVLLQTTLTKNSRPLRYLSIGLLYGLAVSIKLSILLLLTAAFFPLIHTLYSQQRLKAVFWIGAAFALSCAPVFWIKYQYTGTPFFPGLLSTFPGKTPAPILQFLTGALQSKLTSALIFKQLKAFFMGKAVFLLLPLLWMKSTKKLSHERHYLFISLGAFVLYLLINGGVYAPRFYFACLILNTHLIFSSLTHFPSLTKKISTSLLLLALVLADSKIDKTLNKHRDYFKIKSKAKNDREIVRKMIEQTSIWDFIEPESEKIKIISDRWSQSYYAPSKTVVHHLHLNERASFLSSCKEASELTRRGYQYAVIDKETSITCLDKVRRTRKKIWSSWQGFELYKID